ncbi:hypothetical protein [Clostridium magnum]|uniref:PD-(D/E)XK nuclease family transposase n=1 Tax=Clostridium magnum DSM 2767 TaxID=1121326 RepID=A0A162QIR4_9CLOT|nr:hypothetical protein [Clostridium magnum]KZL88577.1 hypothetical protein CLMAG_60700 [Clostridium magnum DSM 2767]SHI83273.1 hypothetical protein SAMN02745944_04925 [Clostridium magnum DSM 2767]
MVYSCIENDYALTLVKEEVNNYGKKKERKFQLQMDKILKRLFTLKNTTPIIDFLNAAYNDNISYEAKLYYADKEINNYNKKISRYISFYADMYIKVIDGEKIYEYEIEFQTVYENSMAIRMFRYGFERAVKFADYSSIKEGKIKIKLPEPYLIVLEENKDIPDDIYLEIEIPKQNTVTYTCKVLKYYNYNIDTLLKENMYLLLPLQIFRLRKKMHEISRSSLPLEKKKSKMIDVYNQLKIVIEGTLKAIDLSYNNSKINLEDYDEMTSAIENINSYFLNMYGKYTDFDEEVKEMVKSFYDPKVEERGIEKGKIETATEMIKEGEPIEKIKKYTKLDENKILELIKQIGTKKVQ